MRPIYAHAGDVFFNHSTSLLGRAIQWGETDPGETPAWANHTGVVVESGWVVPPGTEAPGESAIVVEALWKTRRGPLQLDDITEVRVFGRKPALTAEQVERMRTAASAYVGDTYGWWKLLFQLADRIWFTGKKVFSELLHKDDRPICSYLAAKVFDSVGVRFGVDPQAADPDGMMDYCQTHPEEWEER